MNKLIALLFFPFLSFSQNTIGFDPVDYTFINYVIDGSEKTKDQRFVESVTWITENFKSYSRVVSYEDKDEGIIIGSGSIKVDPTCVICGAKGIHKTYAGWVSFTFKLEIYEDGYSYEFYNFTHDKALNGQYLSESERKNKMMPRKAWYTLKDQVEKKASAIVLSYINHMEY